MSKERYNQIADEVFKKYADSHWTPPENPDGPLLSGKLWSLKPMQHSKETFINECKTDKEFSERWGLEIEERELSRKERNSWVFDNIPMESNFFKGFFASDVNMMTEEDFDLVFTNVPTRVITVTYNNETIEVYE